ncbi:hypothetical protein NPS01_12250 [Nocardioides psychrotolerans]|uniref:Uncharacterized protein n=1 Tax=Nocardioides psychrotolerans TaxID=1005945 RepID=A0A1I3E196_9ACTN|nr:hypothetical protein [Nocardioides psychrotolerans]GEP37562.1 hypothetical protein NPS01_12250 [Nocardioides psychrotolerans]SFH92461.1 hypothetical protein SAMN05216561_103166 [Nocardioides psychrotolerans]
MDGDTDQLRRRVDQLREQGVDVRTLADQLVARTESLGWTGRAAESMRLRIHERATRLRDAAAEHEVAAETLRRHLLQVSGVRESIARRQSRAASLVADARSRATQEQALEDDRVLIAFTPPPSGHRDWLTIELPGL